MASEKISPSLSEPRERETSPSLKSYSVSVSNVGGQSIKSKKQKSTFSKSSNEVSLLEISKMSK